MRTVRIRALFLSVVLVAAGWAAQRAVAADAAAIPMARYWSAVELSSVELSPDGRRIAAIGRSPVGRVLVLIDAETSATEVILRRSQASETPLEVNWINNDLLAVDFSYGASESVDLKGKFICFLGARFIGRRYKHGESLDWVLAYHDNHFEDIDLINGRSGERIKYRVSLPGRLWRWAFDPAGALRAVTMLTTPAFGGTSRLSNWYRDDEASPWQLLLDVPANEETWSPMRVLAEPHQLVVYSREGRDTYAAFRYDTVTRRNVELMAGHPKEDLRALQGLDSPQFDLVVTMGVKPKPYWFDPKLAALQAGVDIALPDRINVIQHSAGGKALVYSYADVDPGRWYMLDTATWKMHEVAERVPAIDPQRMHTTEIVRYAARDGLDITGFLTRPSGDRARAVPMVVLIHGGPWVRDYWGYDPEVQWLAARGYAVFQPQFRGSDGFGRRHKEAGYRQFGRAMQDDITDGVEFLIEHGIVDRQRVCIYGASYGGYAALWGVIKNPELYRCGVSVAGVSDLVDLLSFSFFDDSTIATREANRRMVGDPATMKDELRAVSPIAHADQVRVPLLIAHGDKDRRVLFSQSEDMVERLRKLGKNVEWMPFAGVGHGFYWTSDQLRFDAALLSFLQRHIGGADTSAEPTPPESAAAASTAASGSASASR